VTTIAFFNNKGGVGKTSLVYHVAWMLALNGRRVIAADLDPQANLSSMFVSEERLEAIWSEALWSDREPPTIHGAVARLFRGLGDVEPAAVEPIADNLGLIVGDLNLSQIEDDLSAQWPRCTERDERAFRVVSAFARTLAMARNAFDAETVLIDVGPNLGALNRTALIGADHVVVPLGADLFSLQGLRNMGPKLRDWRGQWAERRGRNPVQGLVLPGGGMQPAGYVVMRHSVRLDRPARAYDRWIGRIPGEYRRYVLDQPEAVSVAADADEHRLALMKDYRSLMPMAQEARKPMFLLRAGDGAFGGHQQAVMQCHADFHALTSRILVACGMEPLS
jgi:chromosome partitioning protein